MNDLRKASHECLDAGICGSTSRKAKKSLYRQLKGGVMPISQELFVLYKSDVICDLFDIYCVSRSALPVG